MKIGIFTESYLPQVNGVVTLIQFLKAGLEERGHTVHVFAPRVRGYVDKEKNVHRFPMVFSIGALERKFGLELDWKISLPLLSRFSDILSTLDVIHTHHMLALGTSAAVYARSRGIPILFTNHTNYKEFEPILPVRRFFALGLRLWLKMNSKLSTCVISPGEKMKQQLYDYYDIKGNIAVIPNGVDIGEFIPPDESQIKTMRAKWGISDNDRVLLYVGRLSKEKNLTFLFDSLSDLAGKRKDIKLILVGNGPMKEELERRVETCGLQRSIVFTGYVPYRDVQRYYSIADIFVTASLSEVFPCTVIEALASSLPVIAMDAVGTGDIIESGQNGCLVSGSTRSFREAVERVLGDDELLKNMRRNARESVKRLSASACIEKHLSLYEKYLRSKVARKKPPLAKFITQKWFVKTRRIIKPRKI